MHGVNTIFILNNKGIPFYVRKVEKGDRYGRNLCLVHDNEDGMVEFYDARYIKEFGGYGQFVSRYFISTFKEIDTDGDFALDLGIENWRISNENIQTIKEMLLND